MGDNSKIEWTNTTWNPVTGCTKVSPGCDHCYAETIHERFNGKGSFAVVQRSEEKLYAPLKWRRPRRVFVNSMSDLFHDYVPLSFIERVFSVMARTPQHTYQLLTKRHARMASVLRRSTFRDAVSSLVGDEIEWPLPNLWLGVSVEDQQWADIRIPALLDTPAAVRWLSCEPLLGPVDLTAHLDPMEYKGSEYRQDIGGIDWFGPRLGWVVCGGESGPRARPMHPDWARKLRDQCAGAGVPFFFKQHGQHAPVAERPQMRDLWVTYSGTVLEWREADGHIRRGGSDFQSPNGDAVLMRRYRGKHDAGRLLDGRTWDEYPEARVQQLREAETRV